MVVTNVLDGPVTRCKSVGFTSINREDKISFIKDGLSKESLDDI